MSTYVWGSNRYGELGLGMGLAGQSLWEPTQLTLPNNVRPTSIAAGEGHTLVVADSGNIYSFGRGKEGQLGLGTRLDVALEPTLIEALQHETIVAAAAGTVSSFAVTATGRVYQWGFVHSHHDDPGEHAAATGTLTGLAQDQDQAIIVDAEAREHLPNFRANANRQLRDIVQHSTEQWLMADEEAENDYHHELELMGYQKEAAGYAHCLLLTRTGTILSAGYNDRGQLGLGHRISTSNFKTVDYLEGKFVVQIVCGQQHSMCRAIDRSCSGGISVGDSVGCPVYIWGNGVLGQLGLGYKGTSKGRLFPTLLQHLSNVAPEGCRDISAGGNFSAAVTASGFVYSWGHAEYNQHGKGANSQSDYVDARYYFIPRELNLNGALVDKISCGTNFTAAVTTTGDVITWGWSAYGVLGHGKGHVSMEPTRISTLGSQHAFRKVSHVVAGGQHVIACAASDAHHWAKTFKHLLHDTRFCDAELMDESESFSLPCHQVVLAARSIYFKSYFSMARRHGTTHEKVVIPFVEATQRNMQYILEYIYTDSIAVPKRSCKEVAALASYLSLHRLASVCSELGAPYSARKSDFIIPPTTFENDMAAFVNNELFADIKFVFPLDENCRERCLFAHKALLTPIPYFNTLFTGRFKIGDEISNVTIFDATSFADDLLDYDVLLSVLQFTYTGELAGVDMSNSTHVMALLLGANRLNLVHLSQKCEKFIVMHLQDYPENVDNCYQYACSYDIPRLRLQCEELLQASLKEAA